MNAAHMPGVLHIDTERTWRGGQQQAAWLFEGLRAQGWPVSFVCARGSVLEERGLARGWPLHALRLRGELDLAAGRRIARIASAGGLRILHAHSSHALSLALWARLFERSLRVVASRRVDFPLRRHPLSRLKYATRLLDRIVCVSEAVRAQLLADGVAPAKLVVIPSGVDTRRFQGVRPAAGLRRALGIPNGHVVIGTVAALADHKDYPTLLRAAALFLQQHPDATFVAVGDGPLRGALAALAAELKLGRRFLFLGFREDVGAILRVLDVFALSSKTEGLGTSVLDAQALGLPVVACRAGGIPEIVADRETGLLVPTRDPAALAAALLEVAGDPALRRALGDAARKAAAGHDVSRTVAAHAELYRGLVTGGAAGAGAGARATVPSSQTR